MKNTMISVAALAIFGSTLAIAQLPPRGVSVPNQRGNAIKQRAPKGDPHAKAAVQQLNQAIVLMNRALPIYDGKRAEADNLCRLARKELWSAAHHGKGNDNFTKLKDNDDKSKYSPDQIEASQKKIREARNHAELALKNMVKSDGTYDETSEAVKDVRKSISLLDKCLGDFGGH